jgi:hypothetical protein
MDFPRGPMRGIDRPDQDPFADPFAHAWCGKAWFVAALRLRLLAQATLGTNGSRVWSGKGRKAPGPAWRQPWCDALLNPES